VSSFNVLILSVGHRKGIRPVKSSATVPKSLLLGTSLTRSNSRKMGQLNKKQVCVWACERVNDVDVFIAILLR